MMQKNKQLAEFGLIYNPFQPGIPDHDIWAHPKAEMFFSRVASIASDGGFAMITGQPGTGKSKATHLLSARLSQLGDIAVGVMERPQSNLGDFYRELGELFGINLSVANRYGSFKALRAKWMAHIASKLYRPVLLIDEAQEMSTQCLNEIRLLGSARFDSECMLTTVLCGDTRLTDRLREDALLPLGSRIRARLVLEPLERDELLDLLAHLLRESGAPNLMTEELKSTVVDHCAGNPRILTHQCAELLEHAIIGEKRVLDENLYFELFGPIYASSKKRNHKNTTRRSS